MEVQKYFDRFMILDDDKSLMGEIRFEEKEGDIIEAQETFVSPSHRGKGLAKILVDLLVSHARINNKKIIPLCSYILKTFSENTEYNDVWKK